MKGLTLAGLGLIAVIAIVSFLERDHHEDFSKPEGVKEEEAAPKYLRFIALGELPPWKEKLVDGIRVGIPPPKWTLPPEAILLDSGDRAVPFELPLRAFTEVLTVAGPIKDLEVKLGDEEANTEWFRHPYSDASLSLAVLCRDPDTMLWDKPTVLLLEDGPELFKSGEIRFVNVSDKMVLIKLGEKAFGIRPSKALIKPLKEGGNPLMVGYLDGQDQEVIWQNRVESKNEERVQCFFYTTQTPDTYGAVRFHYAIEKVPNVSKSAEVR